MRKNKISDALGTVDPAFLQEAAEFTAQPTSLFGKQTFRVLGVCAALVLAVGIALAVAPRLPAILPPNTDTSHIQGTTNTTDQTDSSDTETDSSTDTGVTDTGTNSTTDSEVHYLAFPFSENAYSSGKPTEGFPVKVEPALFIAAGADGAFSENLLDSMKKLLPQVMYEDNEPALLAFADRAPAFGYSALEGKDKISLSLGDWTCYLSYNSTSELTKGAHEALRGTNAVDYYSAKWSDTTTSGVTVDSSVSVQIYRETGLLKDFFISLNDYSSVLKGDVTPEQAKEIATTAVVNLYGADILKELPLYGVSGMLSYGHVTYLVEFRRMYGEVRTEESIKVLVTQSGFICAITTYDLGGYSDIDFAMTTERLESAMKTVQDALGRDKMDLSSVKLVRGTDGAYLLEFYANQSTFWLTIP